jgi:hypothetical protein
VRDDVFGTSTALAGAPVRSCGSPEVRGARLMLVCAGVPEIYALPSLSPIPVAGLDTAAAAFEQDPGAMVAPSWAGFGTRLLGFSWSGNHYTVQRWIDWHTGGSSRRGGRARRGASISTAPPAAARSARRCA